MYIFIYDSVERSFIWLNTPHIFFCFPDLLFYGCRLHAEWIMTKVRADFLNKEILWPNESHCFTCFNEAMAVAGKTGKNNQKTRIFIYKSRHLLSVVATVVIFVFAECIVFFFSHIEYFIYDLLVRKSLGSTTFQYLDIHNFVHPLDTRDHQKIPSMHKIIWNLELGPLDFWRSPYLHGNHQTQKTAFIQISFFSTKKWFIF